MRCVLQVQSRSLLKPCFIHHMAPLSSPFIWQQLLITSEKAPPRIYKKTLQMMLKVHALQGSDCL